MKRLHLFEFNDQSWLPDCLRNAVTEYLAIEWRLAVAEGNGEAELPRVELSGDTDVSHVELRFGGEKGGHGRVPVRV